MKYIFTFVVVLLFFIASCTNKKAPLPVGGGPKCDTVVHYSTTINRIINLHCMPDAPSHSGCHEAGSTNDFTQYSILKAKVDNGVLKNRVYTVANMPSDTALSEADKLRIFCWIQSGGPQN